MIVSQLNCGPLHFWLELILEDISAILITENTEAFQMKDEKILQIYTDEQGYEAVHRFDLKAFYPGNQLVSKQSI